MSGKIAIIGNGYVGLVAAVGLADFGNLVIGVDLDEKKVAKLNKGIATNYEPGIEDYLQRNLMAGRLTFTTDIAAAIAAAEIIFIAVGTPVAENGSADLSQVERTAYTIAKHIRGYKVIVTKSTVPVGVNRWLRETIRRESGREDFDIVSNPEFLREGRAVYDFFHPDRIVIGYETVQARKIMEEIYLPFCLIRTPFIWCNPETAELIKYACNTFLAAKITFINQMANLADAAGADIHVIAKAMGMDSRIGGKFLYPGPGFGGSCFPKDSRALAYTGDQSGIDLSLVKEVIRANEKQKAYITEVMRNLLGSTGGKTIAVLGLAFKAGTDDVRESPVIAIVKNLLEAGAVLKAHDPKAIANFKALYPESQVQYYEDEFAAIENADALLICTEWDEYRNLNLARVKSCMRGNIIYDTRNVLDPGQATQLGFLYKGMGRGARHNVPADAFPQFHAKQNPAANNSSYSHKILINN